MEGEGVVLPRGPHFAGGRQKGEERDTAPGALSLPRCSLAWQKAELTDLAPSPASGQDVTLANYLNSPSLLHSPSVKQG